jgi:Spy/CpxP family protein refolding chaperone
MTKAASVDARGPVAQQVDLKPEQVEELKAIAVKFQKDVEELRPQLRDKQEALQTALYGKQANQRKVAKLVDEISDLRGEYLEAALKSRMATVAMLTSKQVRALKEYEAKEPGCGANAAAKSSLVNSDAWDTLGVLLAEEVKGPEQKSSSPMGAMGPMAMEMGMAGGGCGGGCGDHAAPQSSDSGPAKGTTL